MNELRYRVEPRSILTWKLKRKLVFDLFRKDEYWHDPSYGNGGGDWRSSWTRLATYKYLIDAVRKRNEFNKLESEKYESRN